MSTHLELGTIIQINSPTNPKYHDKIFLIDYFDRETLRIINDITLDIMDITIEDGKPTDESIESITILSRPEEKGYARQNGLLPNTWIDMYFGGDVPTTFTGQITDLEEDMIEITLYPTKDVIYIDFEYKGIPKQLPIEKIQIRNAPIEEVVAEKKDLSVIAESNEDGDDEEPEFDDDEFVVQQTPGVQEKLREILVEADDFVLGDEVDEITQEVYVDEKERRYNIDDQTEDLMNEMLSKIPNVERTVKVLNNLNQIIQRFKQLRENYSVIDQRGVVTEVKKRTFDHKPLVEKLQSLNTNLRWLLPVVQNRKRVYDIDDVTLADTPDVISLNMAETRTQDAENDNKYYENDGSDDTNKYKRFIRNMSQAYTPFIQGESSEDVIYRGEVGTDITVVIDNIIYNTQSLYSTVTSNDSLKRQRFVIGKYNLGLNLHKTNYKDTFDTTIVEPISRADEAHIKGFLVLPKQFMTQSRLTLPNTSIFEKSDINTKTLQYWQLLRKATSVTNQLVDNETDQSVMINEDFMKEVLYISLDQTVDEDEKYRRFLQAFVPKTELLFDMLKKYNTNKTAYIDIVNYLEPFMVYKSDILFSQYKGVVDFVVDNIKKLLGRLAEHQPYTNSLRNWKVKIQYSGSVLLSIMDKYETRETGEERDLDSVLLKYGVDTSMYSSEVVRKIMKTDYGRLYMDALSMYSSSLYSSVNIKEKLEEKINLLTISDEQSPDDAKCSTLKLAKYYLDFDELTEDNNKEIFFDKKYDETRYDTITDYKDQQDTMSEEEFRSFLAMELMMNVGLKGDDADREVDAMIRGQRLVQDGDYAIFETFDGEGNRLYHIYKRENQNWVLDEDKTTHDDVTANSYFCNSEQKCLSMKNECKSVDEVKKDLNKNATEDIIKKVLDEYEISADTIKENIAIQLALSQENIDILRQLMSNETYEYSRSKYAIGINVESQEIVTSPYTRLRDLIIQQEDLMKRISNLSKFINMYTRPANKDADPVENEYWLYCVQTGTPLIPSFYDRISKSSPYTYEQTLQEICDERGTSDDGNKWVDKHSGYVIRELEFDDDEGYDESGFKINTKEAVESDASEQIKQLNISLEEKTKSVELRYINNVITSLSYNIGVNIEDSREFIVKQTLQLINEIHGDKVSYNKKRKLAKEKGKKIASYELKLHQFILYFTGLFVLFSVQCAIPSIKTKKTYPNCKRSFSGYPMEDNGDFSGLEYIVCIMKKTTGGSEPWNSIKKLSVESIVKNMKIMYNKYVSSMPVIQQKTKAKLDYREKTDASDEIPESVSIGRWHTFLPPLQRFDLGGVVNINEIFQRELFSHLKSGNKKQDGELDILKGKILYKSLEIIQDINKIVQKEAVLLETKAGEPYLENACCRTDLKSKTLKYFTKKDSSIERNSEDVFALTELLYRITNITRSPMLFSNAHTKLSFAPVLEKYSESTIYQGFIEFCKINRDVPVKDNIVPYCLHNKSGFKMTDSLDERIAMLKSEGKQFSLDGFLQLLNQVNKNRSIQLQLHETIKSNEQMIVDYITHMNESEQHIDNTMEQLFIELLDTYSLVKEDSRENYDALYDYISETTDELRATVIEYIETKSNMSSSIKLKTKDYLHELAKFKEIKASDIHDSKDNSFVYKRDYLSNVCKQLLEDFPNMIVNNIDFSSVKIPSHWNLSKRHNKDVSDIIKRTYEPLKQNYKNESMFPLLKSVTKNKAPYMNILEYLPFMYSRNINNTKVESLFDAKLVNAFYEFIIVKSFMLYIDTLETRIESEFDDFEIEDMGEEIVQESATSAQREQLANMLLDYCTILSDQKRIININKQSIMEHIMIIRDTEKDRITRYLKDLTEEERKVDTAFKHMKLGRWSKGMQKGLTQYVKETYDEERADAEQQALLDLQLNANMNVSDMNRDVLRFEIMERHMVEDAAEREAYDMSHMADDDEYAEGLDGDEDYGMLSTSA